MTLNPLEITERYQSEHTDPERWLAPYVNVDPGWCELLNDGELARCVSAIEDLRTMRLRVTNLPVRHLVVEVKRSGIGVSGAMHVADRSSGREADISLFSSFSLQHMALEGANIVRQMLHKMLTHEIDECLLIEGKRRWDPHVEP